MYVVDVKDNSSRKILQITRRKGVCLIKQHLSAEWLWFRRSREQHCLVLDKETDSCCSRLICTSFILQHHLIPLFFVAQHCFNHSFANICSFRFTLEQSRKSGQKLDKFWFSSLRMKCYDQTPSSILNFQDMLESHPCKEKSVVPSSFTTKTPLCIKSTGKQNSDVYFHRQPSLLLIT